MSGALTELVAKGAQDAYLTGDPQVSFFHQAYKRHTNFAQKPVQVDFTGTAGASQQINMKLLNKGDLLGYIWMDMTGTAATVTSLQDTIFELYIGGQLIDRQDGFYMIQLWQKFLVDSSAKGYATIPLVDDSTLLDDILASKWLPLHFFFCDSMCYLPLVALQYHEVEVRITFGSGVSSFTSTSQPTFYANYVVLDTTEREAIVKKEHNLLIEQVQRIVANSGSTDGSNKFDLSYLNHPVKCLLWGDSDGTSPFYSNTVQLYLNGTEVFGSPMPDVFFTQVQGYYHSEFASELLKGQGNATGTSQTGRNLKMYSFALKANKHQPCGTCNFSRLDNAALTFTQVGAPTTLYLYAVNFNIFRIKNGLGGLAFSS
jgi:hypothetical protein